MQRNRDQRASSSPRPRATARAEQSRNNEVENLDRHFLRSNGFPDGFIDALMENRNVVQQVFWILDNSASMRGPDGNRMTQYLGKIRLLKCTRLEELQETILFHIDLAASISVPSTFRLLNHPGPNAGEQIFSVAATPEAPTHEHDVSMAKTTIQKVKPRGNTPLTEHIQAIRRTIDPMNEDLKANGKKIAIVIATDGIPTNEFGIATAHAKETFMAEYRELSRLAVLLVVRLCTDEESVVDFWNSLDKVVESPLDVLDDFISEAKEVYLKNPWLTYGLPLQRLREMGFEDKILDMLDETQLSLSDVCGFLRILFGNVALPSPDMNWKLFCEQVEGYLSMEQMQYNPIHGKMMPWIDMRVFRKVYKPRGWLGF